jgi:hypothetical protein
MSTYAKVNAYGVVENVIVADAAFVKSRRDASSHVETFIDANGEAAKLYNYAVIGGRFDATNNAFISPTPYASWVLDDKFAWVAPVPVPEAKAGVYYVWDEPTVGWVEKPLPTAPTAE